MRCPAARSRQNREFDVGGIFGSDSLVKPVLIISGRLVHSADHYLEDLKQDHQDNEDALRRALDRAKVVQEGISASFREMQREIDLLQERIMSIKAKAKAERSRLLAKVVRQRDEIELLRNFKAAEGLFQPQGGKGA